MCDIEIVITETVNEIYSSLVRQILKYPHNVILCKKINKSTILT